jgi:hypothetical protein
VGEITDWDKGEVEDNPDDVEAPVEGRDAGRSDFDDC